MHLNTQALASERIAVKTQC